MNKKISRHLFVSTLAVAVAFSLASCAASPAPAQESGQEQSLAASESLDTVVSDASVLAHFDLAGGQLPENIVEAADGGVLMTFAASRQIAHVSPEGDTAVIATLPASSDSSAETPVLGFPLVTGLVRDDDVIYTLLATGAPDTTGVWKIDNGASSGKSGAPEMIAALPSTGLPNGLALDAASNTLFVADSVTGTIFAVPTAGGDAEVWSDDTALRTTGFLGVNGLKLRDGAIYASNLDLGTLLRIPLNSDGSAGDIETVASDLVGIDDFDFTGNGDEIVATIDPDSTVVLVQENGTHEIILSAEDGLSNPTSALVADGKLYIPSAAYVTQEDPNLLVADIAIR